MTKLQKQEFEEKANELIEWLCENCHPHSSILITPTSAELSEGVLGFTTDKHIVD